MPYLPIPKDKTKILPPPFDILSATINPSPHYRPPDKGSLSGSTLGGSSLAPSARLGGAKHITLVPKILNILEWN